jgi:hypothetical protein
MKLRITFICVFILLPIISLRAQNYNINFVPVRLTYDKQYYSNKRKLGVLFLYKFLEMERKLNNHISLNFGIAYDKDKEEIFNGLYKEIFYKINPSIRYYLNNQNNISGFYLGNGFSYSRFSYDYSGRFASSDESIKERKIYQHYLDFNLQTGYKLCLFKKRVSVDLKLIEEILFLNRQKVNIINNDNSVNETNSSFKNGKIYYPYLDLKLGYRFGFKK